MAEMELIIEQVRLTYEGLFKATEIYKLIDNWLRTHGYDKREMKTIEKVTPSGKYIEIESLPWKKQTEYVKNDIKFVKETIRWLKRLKKSQQLSQ